MINKNIINKLMKEFLPNFYNAESSTQKVELFRELYINKKSLGKDDKYKDKISSKLEEICSDDNLKNEIEDEISNIDILIKGLINSSVPKVDIYGNEENLAQADSSFINRLDKTLKRLYKANWNKEIGYVFDKDKYEQEISIYNIKLFMAEIINEIIDAFGASEKPHCGDYIGRCKNCNKLIGKTRSDKDHCSEECQKSAKSKRKYLERKQRLSGDF